MNDHISKIKAALDVLGPGRWYPYQGTLERGKLGKEMTYKIAHVSYHTHLDALVSLLNSAAAIVAEAEAPPRTERRAGPWTRRVWNDESCELTRRDRGYGYLDRRRANPYNFAGIGMSRETIQHLQTMQALARERDVAIAERDYARRAHDKCHEDWAETNARLQEAKAERDKLRIELSVETKRCEEAEKDLKTLKESYSSLVDTYTEIQHKLLSARKHCEELERAIEIHASWRTDAYKQVGEQTTRADKWKTCAESFNEYLAPVTIPRSCVTAWHDALAYEQSLTQPQEDRKTPGAKADRKSS